MRITCSICQELLLPSTTSLSIPCGHIYHAECLLQWLSQNKSCPQCRTSVRTKPFKVYFDVSEDSDESIEKKLQESVTECLDWREKCSQLNSQLETLESQEALIVSYKADIDKLKDEVTYQHCKIISLKMQLATVTTLKSDNSKLRSELDSAQEELSTLRNAKCILEGTEAEVSENLKHYECNEQSIRQLCTYVEGLRKLSNKYKNRCESIAVKCESFEKQIISLSKEKEDLQNALTEAMEAHYAAQPREEEQPCLLKKEEQSSCNLGIFDDVLQENERGFKILSAKDIIRKRPKTYSKTGQNSGASNIEVYTDGLGRCKRMSSLFTRTTEEEKRAYKLKQKQLKSKAKFNICR